MKSKPIYTEEQFQERLNKELRQSIAAIANLKAKNEKLEKSNKKLYCKALKLEDRLTELSIGTHEMKFKSEICIFRPFAIKDLQRQIIREMDKEDCIKYEDLEDGTVMASVRVLDWHNHEVKSFIE